MNNDIKVFLERMHLLDTYDDLSEKTKNIVQIHDFFYKAHLYYETDKLVKDKLINSNHSDSTIDINMLFRRDLIFYCANIIENIFTLFLKEHLIQGGIHQNFADMITKRKFHSFFDFKANNTNKFLKMFGNEFKQKLEENDIKFKIYEQSFFNMLIGRNDMIHDKFDELPKIEEKEKSKDLTIEDIIGEFLKSLMYYDTIVEYLRLTRQ